ncbi:MAG: BadF/BadG/BcrA/BcrD ATPase family protein [Acholeplasmataceae bacterium]|nr:BadF/BadG/BcrA/BcrD ATPase family protein [Acholeplasmataceae bacterium]
MNKYIIGVDGGGTKTLGVLFDISGHELKRVEFGFSNFSIDEEIAKSNVEKTIAELAMDLEDERELFIQMGIAGYSKIKKSTQFVKSLEKKFNATVDLDSDAIIALYSVKQNKDINVIMVIGGTGSVLMVSDGEEANLVGGFGHLLGDEGSAYHLAITALKKIIEEKESNQELSELSKMILKEIEALDYLDIKNFVYNNNKSDIARLAKFIAHCALNHDLDAISLLKQEGRHLAKQTINAYNKSKKKDNVVIALRGGFLLNAPYVKETLIEELKISLKDFEIDIHPIEPVIGAYYLGLLKLSKRCNL